MQLRVRTIIWALAAALLWADPGAAVGIFYASQGFGLDNGFIGTLDGSGPETLVSGITPTSLAVDPVGEKIYWTNLEPGPLQLSFSINRANLDGTGVERIVPELARPPIGIGVDSVNRKVYWRAGDEIQSSNLDGSSVASHVFVGPFVARLAVAPSVGKLYWVQSGSDSAIFSADQRRPRRHTDVEKVLGTSVLGDLPSGLAVDHAAGQLYFTAGGINNGKIYRIGLDGSNLETLLDGLAAPLGVGVDGEGKLYWTTLTGALRRADLDGSNIEDLFAGLQGNNDLAVISSSAPPPLPLPIVPMPPPAPGPPITGGPPGPGPSGSGGSTPDSVSSAGPSVPEPGALALFVVGLALTGGRLRYAAR